MLFLRISATNTASVPRYAFLRTIWPSKGLGEGNALPYTFEEIRGLAFMKAAEFLPCPNWMERRWSRRSVWSFCSQVNRR